MLTASAGVWPASMVSAQKTQRNGNIYPGRRAGDHAHDQGGNGPAADFEPGQDL